MKKFKATKNSSWYIASLGIIEIEEGEVFDEDTVGDPETVDQMVELGYAEELSADQSIYDMSKQDLIAYAEEKFGKKLSGIKQQIIEQIEELNKTEEAVE